MTTEILNQIAATQALENMTIEELRAALLEQLSKPAPETAKTTKAKTTGYRILSTEINWYKAPQLTTIKGLLKDFEGRTFTDQEMVEAMEKTGKFAGSKQGAKAVWDFYKGDSKFGMVRHGNLERV